MTLAQWKELGDVLQSFVTVGAILVGGMWTWMLFVRNRLKYPRAAISQELHQRSLGRGKVWLHVAVEVRNSGDVLIRVESILVRLQQVRPLVPAHCAALDKGEPLVIEGESEVRWHELQQLERHWRTGVMEMEPGEADSVPFDFVVDEGVTTVEVYSYVRNRAKRGRDIGWSDTRIYELGHGGNGT